MKYSRARPPCLPAAKSDLLKCICSQQPELPAESDCKIYDGAVIVHCLPVTGAVTFDDYAEKIFLPYIQSQHGSRQIDIVWDSYALDSLKEATREKRGKGVKSQAVLRSPRYECNSSVTR